MDWRNIPSLSALRAFEATARTGSFSAAAKELNVTHAAIAQHARALEAFFEAALLERQGRSMVPTDAGRRLAAGLSGGFRRIEAAVTDTARQSRNAPLQITVTPQFAQSWLVPRLARFWDRHPDIALSFVPTSKVADLSRDGLDMAIRFGRGSWPPHTSHKLLDSRLIVVAAPEVETPGPGCEFSELARHKWIFVQSWSEQYALLKNAGMDPASVEAVTYPTSELAVSAVLAGHGLTLHTSTNAAADLAAGRLKIVCNMPDSGLGYHLVIPANRENPKRDIFVDWLLTEARENPTGQHAPTQ